MTTTEEEKCRCTGRGNCLATPEKPCFCPCHISDYLYIETGCKNGRCNCKNKSEDIK